MTKGHDPKTLLGDCMDHLNTVLCPLSLLQLGGGEASKSQQCNRDILRYIAIYRFAIIHSADSDLVYIEMNCNMFIAEHHSDEKARKVQCSSDNFNMN